MRTVSVMLVATAGSCVALQLGAAFSPAASMRASTVRMQVPLTESEAAVSPAVVDVLEGLHQNKQFGFCCCPA